MDDSQGLLTVDCGNTTVRCRRPDGEVFATPSASPEAGRLAAFAGEAGVGRAVAVSVVPSALATVREALRTASIPLDVAGEDLPCPLALDYATPATLGADRWLAAFAAHRRFGAAVVVDCGTATTVDVVTGAGRFRGGAIAPGLPALAIGLGRAAPALPPPDLGAAVSVPARSTQASVDAGVVLGHAGAVERLVREARRSLSEPSRVVATGGHAAGLLALVDFDAAHVPELLHEGLALLAGSSPCGS